MHCIDVNQLNDEIPGGFTMSQAAVPILNMLILGSFMVFSLIQIRSSQVEAVKVRIDEKR